LFLLLREHASKPAVRLMLIFGVLEFLILLSLNYKVMRYTYPLFTLLAIPTALGLTRLLRLNWERLIALGAILLALLFGVMPAAPENASYAGLTQAGEIARRNGLPLVLSGWYHSTWGAWVAQYYLDRNFRMEPPATGEFIEVTDRPRPALPDTRFVGRQGRVWMYLNSSLASRRTG